MDASYNAKPAVVAVVGPTATGKTALGVALAQQFSGEVISADSMQIYKGLDVGTAKVTPQETCGIPHHGVDILTPEKTFSVADFTALAGEYIQDITARGHLPLLVGGTGLYVQSLLYGVRFTAVKAPDGLREQLTAELEANGPEAMYAKLQAVDPEAAAAIHPNNKVRVLRALEHYRATGKRLSEQKADSLPPERPYRSLVLGLDFPDRACSILICIYISRTAQRCTAASTCGWTKCWRPGFWPRQNTSGITAKPSAPPHRPSAIKIFFRISSRPPRLRSALKSSNRPPATTQNAS